MTCLVLYLMGHVRLFADDCLAYRPIHSDQDQIILQQDLTALQNWAERWGMRFNPQKCYIMHIHRSQIRSRIYQLYSEVLYSVSKAKYLGVLISNDLSWNEQVCKVAAKANTTLHFISRNLKHCPISMRQTVYAPLHVQAWSIAPVSGTLICRRIKSDWRRLTDERPELSSMAPGETPTWAPLPYYTNYSGPPGDPQISPADVPYVQGITQACCSATHSSYPASSKS